jgi:FMN phosphatase YigB (HAD superfamily)
VELVRDLSKKYVTATLSNISEFQWSKIRASGIPDHMSFNFISCEIGCVKPDREAFDHVMRTLGCGPAGFYFFDDNRVNVEAAAGFGIPAFLTRGIGELKRALSDLGITG